MPKIIIHEEPIYARSLTWIAFCARKKAFVCPKKWPRSRKKNKLQKAKRKQDTCAKPSAVTQISPFSSPLEIAISHSARRRPISLPSSPFRAYSHHLSKGAEEEEQSPTPHIIMSFCMPISLQGSVPTARNSRYWCLYAKNPAKMRKQKYLLAQFNGFIVPRGN